MFVAIIKHNNENLHGDPQFFLLVLIIIITFSHEINFLKFFSCDFLLFI